MPIPSELREQLPARMSALNLSGSDLCKLAGLSNSQLSDFLRGKKDLSIKDVNLVHNVLLDLENIADACRPLPIDFRNTKAVRDSMQRIENGEIRIERSDACRARKILSALRREELCAV